MRTGTCSLDQVLWDVAHSRDPNGQITPAGLSLEDIDPLTNETPPSLVELRKAVRNVTGGRVVGICNTGVDIGRGWPSG